MSKTFTRGPQDWRLFRGRTLWGAAILTCFAVGYSLPPAGGLVGMGLGLGKLSSLMGRFGMAIKVVAGLSLIGIGFYLLAMA